MQANIMFDILGSDSFNRTVDPPIKLASFADGYRLLVIRAHTTIKWQERTSFWTKNVDFLIQYRSATDYMDV